MRRRRFTWKKLVAVGSCLSTAVAVVCLYALLRTPGWYAPPVVPPAERQQVRDSLVAAEQAMTESLRRQGRFVYTLRQDDVNRWLSARREIYLQVDEYLPPELSDPFIRFADGAITLAGRVASRASDVIVSMDVQPTWEDDAIVLRATALRCGSVRIPLDWDSVNLAAPIDRAPETTWPGSPEIRGDLLSGLRIGTRAWWKNGGTEYRVVGLSVEPGVLRLEIEPLGPHYVRRVNDQP